MDNKLGISRFFGGCCKNNNNIGLIVLLALGALLLLGDELLEWIFCEDMALIWIVLIVLLLLSFDDGYGCC